MNSIKYIILISALCVLGSCKKTYTCECKNPGGVYETHNLNATKANAKKSCDKYNDQANTTPWSESFCELK